MDQLKLLLEERDKKQKNPFENLIFTIREYASQLESVMLMFESMRVGMRRNNNNRFSISHSLPQNHTSDSDSKVLKELKEERAELYRQQGTQATHLLALNEQLREKESTISALNAHISEMKVKNLKGDKEMSELKEKLREGEAGIQIMKDELVALQLELLRRWEGEGKQPTCTTITSNNLIRTETDSKEEEVVDLPDAEIDFSIQKIGHSPDSNGMTVNKEKEIIAPHKYPISSVTSLASVHILLTGSEDQKIISYDLTRISTKAVLKWSKINGPIVSMAVGLMDGDASKDGEIVVASCSAYDDKQVTIWNLGSGKIINTLQYSIEDDSGVPLLKIGGQSKLWLSLGRSLRLWDLRRGLLLRSWNKEQIQNEILEIIPDAARPDKVWCFDAKGYYAVFNAITGKIEKPWAFVDINFTDNGNAETDARKQLNMIFSQCIRGKDSANFLCVGLGIEDLGSKIICYKLISTTQTIEGIFEIFLNDLLPSVTRVYTVKLHPTRSDLLAVSTNSGVLMIKISPDHWTPQWKLISTRDGKDNDDKSSEKMELCWGPEEIDPISGEFEWKLVIIEKESKKMLLYTVKL